MTPLDVRLDSISLVFDEAPLLGNITLGSLTKENWTRYQSYEVVKEEEQHSPRLRSLPEIFRQKLKAYSKHYFDEVARQNRITDVVRYNFSDGRQISAREILRHPHYKKVPVDLLPQNLSADAEVSVFSRWPLITDAENLFISQAFRELEDIMQRLLARIIQEHRQRKIDVYLQSASSLRTALKLQLIDFDPTQEMDWRVDFQEKKQLETEVKLVSFRKHSMGFFSSFAVDPEDGVVIVHPWKQELSQLQEVLSSLDEYLLLRQTDMPVVNLRGELAAKVVLKHLRSRPLPVKITGGVKHLERGESLIEIRLNEHGHFYLQHEGRVLGQKNLVRRGWTTRSILFLETLSQGLSFMLNAEARDVATRSRLRREWDMKLLKHLGVLQYLFLEVLSLHFDGALTDGQVLAPADLFAHLQPRIRDLLVANSGQVFVAERPLSELVSKAVLSCFEDFVRLSFEALSENESFYSEEGEIIAEGVVEREFRLIYEMLHRLALYSQGEAFRRARTPFLSRITPARDQYDDVFWDEAVFHFPSSLSKGSPPLNETLEALQPLIPAGFKIFYKDQVLQELQEDEFHVDFVLQAEGDQRFFNWFELNPKFFLRGQEVDPDQFLSLGSGGVVEYEGKLFLVPQKQLPSLRRLENFWQKLQKGKTEAGGRQGREKIYKLPRHQTLELLALRASGVEVRGDHEWKRLCEFYDQLGNGDRELNLPSSIKADLKPYQRIGVRWLQDLYQLRLGALLADDMGLGKTLQTLCFLEALRAQDEMGQVLIVVPSSLIFNWQQEIEKFTPQLPVQVFSPRDRESLSRRLGAKEPLVVLITYGLLMEHEAFLQQYPWRVMVFDEAQNLKNISAKRTSSARSIPAQFKICLTGTPMENHYGEFYSLVDLLVPGSLGKIEEFRRQFVQTEMVTREQIDDLKLKIKPLLLRRSKKEILDQLPEKQETKVSIAFEERQKQIYRDIALAYNQRVQETMAVQGQASVQLQMLTALLRLRQACSDPAALPNVRYDKVPPKLETLLDSLGEIIESGESALVFTQFLQTLEHTEKLLRAAGIPVFSLHGSVASVQRQKILAEFNRTNGGAVLLMTLKTGGVGLNLTKASYVFHLEPWWNPSVENQATDRAHRMGQTKAVQVFRYIMHESLEEKIELLKERKDRKFKSLFTSTEKDIEIGAGSAALSKQDFDLLLGI